MSSLSAIVDYALQNDATDIHLQPGELAFIRIQGALTPVDVFDVQKREDLSVMANGLMKEAQKN